MVWNLVKVQKRTQMKMKIQHVCCFDIKFCFVYIVAKTKMLLNTCRELPHQKITDINLIAHETLFLSKIHSVKDNVFCRLPRGRVDIVCKYS